MNVFFKHAMVATVLLVIASVRGSYAQDTLFFDFDSVDSCLFGFEEINNTLYDMNITGGELRISKPAGGPIGFSLGQLWSRFQVVGDFDIQVKYRLITFASHSQFQLNTYYPTSRSWHAGMRRNMEPSAPGDYSTWWASTCGTIATGDTEGYMRWTRTGGSWRGYKKSPGGAWTLVCGPVSSTSGPMYFALSGQNNGSGNPAIDVAYDSLLVIAASFDSLDSDADAVFDYCDNCVATPNPLQEDFDSDGLGDACFLPAYLRPLRIVLREVTPPSQGETFAPTDPELNMIVTDPTGLVIGADSFGVIINTIGDSASYSEINGEDSVQINDPKTGDYQIEIFPEVGSNQAGRAYIIGIRTDGTVEQVLGPFTSPLSGEIDTAFYQTIPYLWGDCDASRSVNIADVTAMIARIFSSGPACAPPESGDSDCTGSFNIADVTHLIAYIFSSGAAPGCD